MKECDTSEPCDPNAGCGPTSANALPCEPMIGSLGVRLQGAVDRARRLPQALGLRRERVYLVWQRQDEQTRAWKEHQRIELVPVKVSGLSKIDKALGDGGLRSDGEVTLTEVSPAQVSIRTLQGWIGDEDWPNASEREFFFEIERGRRCEGDGEEPRMRFTLASEIEAQPFGYKFRLLTQHVPRGDGGIDMSVEKIAKRRDYTLRT